MALLEITEATRLGFEVTKVFTPSTPINDKELFAGRLKQIEMVVNEAIAVRGRHAIIYGERGVGKTSLTNILAPWLQGLGQKVFAPRINCDVGDNFSTAWRKMFQEVALTCKVKNIGFKDAGETELRTLADGIGENVTPGEIRSHLASLGGGTVLILIFDEFDRIKDTKTNLLFADTIKNLSDHAIHATVILAGVADTVADLIAEHNSIERALVQIEMRRMNTAELQEIVDNGIKRLSMTITADAREQIVTLSQGLPHYTHLLGLNAVRAALEERSSQVEMKHFDLATEKAVGSAQHTLVQSYHTATTSGKKVNLYADVLLACAMAKGDDLGYFAAADVREPLKTITGKSYMIPTFIPHLSRLCGESRGPALIQTGQKYRNRYRFTNPLLQPFVLLKGYAEKKIKR